MKTRCYYLGMLAFIGCCCFLLPGCEKATDYFKHTGETDLKQCNITRMFVYLSFSPELGTDTFSYTFAYNYLGNPVSITNSMVGTGNPNIFFKYDKRNRLIELIAPYLNNIYQEWDRYGYNNKNQVVKDTIYGFGQILGGQPLPSTLSYSYTTFEYDTQGRIIRQTDSIFEYGGHFDYVTPYVFNYDARGNLINGAVYDNKLSYKRTNNVWMFITRDYSINNPFTAIQYNDHDLPLHFMHTGLNVVPAEGQELRIEYQCR